MAVCCSITEAASWLLPVPSKRIPFHGMIVWVAGTLSCWTAARTSLIPKLFAASAFTATMALAVSLDTAKSFGVSEVRAAVQQLNLPATQTIMPWNGIRFDGTGNNQLAASVIEQQTGNGFQVVYPNELAAAKITWP